MDIIRYLIDATTTLGPEWLASLPLLVAAEVVLIPPMLGLSLALILRR